MILERSKQGIYIELLVVFGKSHELWAIHHVPRTSHEVVGGTAAIDRERLACLAGSSGWRVG